MANPSVIIAAINPKRYSSKPAELTKEIKTYGLDEGIKMAGNPTKPLSKPAQAWSLSYNSAMESLEPVYFWLLDFASQFGNVEKLNDTFQSTVGSGHFSELMGKATRMQEEGMKIMQTIGVLIKSVINIVYDLKQFELRLNDYKAAESDDPNRKDAGQMALKQVWLDNVDIKRGNSSIKAMTFSQQGAFVTLLNAFMAAKSLKEIDGMDLNDIVKRVLKQRYLEFEEWVKLSKSELTKRYNIQRHWLKSQVDSIKLYSRWAQPYFKAAEALRQTEDPSNPNLINTFNSIVLNLSVWVTKKIGVEDSVISKDLPGGFEKLDEKKQIRPTYSCILLEFTFRGIPQKVDQHYGFGGKSEVSFKAFALNQDELDLLKAKLDDSDISEALKMVKVATESSLNEIQDDINYFLKDIEEREKEEKKEKEKSNVSPFTALLNLDSLFGKKEEKKKDKKGDEKKKKERIEELKKGIKPDTYPEKLVRALAEEKARKSLFTVYDVYKKAHGMASMPFGDALIKREIINVSFGDIFKK